MGRGFSAMKRRIPSGIRFDKAGGMARHGRDAIWADNGLLGLMGSEGSFGGAGTRTTPGGSTEAARQPARFVAIAGRRGRETILSDMRSVMLRLGDAPPGKADVLPDFQQFAPALTRKGGCFGAVRLAFRHAGSVPECPVGRRPQKSPPCGGLCHSRWRTGFRDCPREGARSCLQPGMHAVLSEEGSDGSEVREEGASRLMREKPLPSMLVSSVAGLRPGPKRQPFLLPCGRRCGGRRR